MENSSRIHFENDTPQWYVSLGKHWVGPFSALEIYEKILAQEISWVHFIWKKGQPNWRRICDLKIFQSLLPQPPEKSIMHPSSELPRAAGSNKVRPPIEPRQWYLYYNDSQFGPFSQEEILRFLKVGKIHLRIYAWKEGMSNWERLGRIPVFQNQAKSPNIALAKDKAPEPKELRSSPRRPLVAKIFLSDDQSVIVGVCRDISVGGMQVLTERVPGKVGTRFKMNISPSLASSNDRMDRSIEAFVAEGIIVRILEDGRGFSFRFERLPESARQTIESYIESPG